MKTRSIPGFSKYLATDDGRIVIKSTGEFLRQTGSEYLMSTMIDDDGKKVRVLVHRIIASAWHKNSHKKPMVDHKDGNKKNNSPDNLKWATGSENASNPNTHVNRKKTFGRRDGVKMLIELSKETKEWLENRADENGRATKREAEQIIEDVRKKER